MYLVKDLIPRSQNRFRTTFEGFTMQDSSLDVRQYITFLMSALANRGNRLLEESLKAHDLTLGTFYIMSLIVSNKDQQMMSQKSIADRLQMNVNTVTRYLDDIGQRGYARRVSNPDNRKENLIEVTPEGYKCVREAYADIEGLRRRAYACLSKTEFEQLRRLLLRIYNSEVANSPQNHSHVDNGH